MRFTLGGREYDVTSVQDVTLRDTLLLEAQMRELGREMTWPDLTTMILKLSKIKDDKARAAHPDAMWSLAVTIWASRRAAGEDVTIAQAADFRMSDLQWVDEKPEPEADPTEAQPAPGLGEPSE